jgi:hypothetical protein
MFTCKERGFCGYPYPVAEKDQKKKDYTANLAGTLCRKALTDNVQNHAVQSIASTSGRTRHQRPGGRGINVRADVASTSGRTRHQRPGGRGINVRARRGVNVRARRGVNVRRGGASMVGVSLCKNPGNAIAGKIIHP